jgi:hypothetical protein
VSRKLSSKFLQVFGCTIDVAVDGVVAVNKMMNLEKYDLVLMVSFALRCFASERWLCGEEMVVDMYTLCASRTS